MLESMFEDPLRVYRVQVELTAADLRALSGETKVIVPGVPGYVIIPVLTQFDRLAGTAYTLNGVLSAPQLKWSGVGGFQLGAATANGFVNAAGPSSVFQAIIGSIPPTSTYAVVGAAVVAGRDQGTDLSGGSGSVIITFWYRLFKVPQ